MIKFLHGLTCDSLIYLSSWLSNFGKIWTKIGWWMFKNLNQPLVKKYNDKYDD